MPKAISIVFSLGLSPNELTTIKFLQKAFREMKDVRDGKDANGTPAKSQIR